MELTSEEWADQGRVRKVRLVCPILREWGITPSELVDWSEYQWAEVASIATLRCGSTVGVPSEESRKKIIANMSQEPPTHGNPQDRHPRVPAHP